MAVKKNQFAALSECMLRVLECQRADPSGTYPLPLRRLALLTDPETTPDHFLKAVGTKPFSEQAVLAQKKNFDAPVALQEDLQALAATPVLLEFVLESLSTADHPLWPISKLKAKVDAKLKKPFEAALKQQIHTDSLPPSVGCVTVRKTSHLHLKRFPLPPPPREPALEVAENLLHLLAAQQRLGEGSYPLSMQQLTGLLNPRPAPAVLKKALAARAFQEAVLVAAKNKPAAPVVLASDVRTLANSTQLLEFALAAARQPMNEALSIARLKAKLVPPLRQHFEEAVNRRIEEDTLPAAVGWVWSGRKRLLFLLGDVHGSKQESLQRAPSSGTAESKRRASAVFAASFDAAFEQLDRAAGSHNLVSLVDLRRLLGVDRTTFDTGVQQLRHAGRYSLSAAEGRHGLRPEEEAAGILEDGALLLYAARRPG
jgi:hypothetical protein